MQKWLPHHHANIPGHHFLLVWFGNNPKLWTQGAGGMVCRNHYNHHPCQLVQGAGGMVCRNHYNHPCQLAQNYSVQP